MSGVGGATAPGFTSFMGHALAEAKAAGARGEAPIGAVIVRRGQGVVIARAGNECRGAPDPTAHAEIIAIRRAAAALGQERLTGCELWVTLEPCAMCAGAIAHARLDRVIFAADDPKGGGVRHGPRVFDQPTTHHRPEVVSGVDAAAAAELLRGFFAARR